MKSSKETEVDKIYIVKYLVACIVSLLIIYLLSLYLFIVVCLFVFYSLILLGGWIVGMVVLIRIVIS